METEDGKRRMKDKQSRTMRETVKNKVTIFFLCENEQSLAGGPLGALIHLMQSKFLIVELNRARQQKELERGAANDNEDVRFNRQKRLTGKKRWERLNF